MPHDITGVPSWSSIPRIVGGLGFNHVKVKVEVE